MTAQTATKPRRISTASTLGFVRRNWEILAFAAALLACCLYYATALGCRIDDSFIYLRVAENFLDSGRPIYNIGDERFISTSPLWLFLIIAAKLVVWGAELTSISKWLYILSLVASSLCLRSICRGRYPLAASLAPLAVFCSPLAINAVGMEFAVTLATGLALIRAFERQKWILFGFCGGLFYLARSEGALLVAVMMAVFVGRMYRQSGSRREFLARVWTPIDACLIVVMIWHLYYLMSFGRFFPDTLHAKIEQGLSGIWPLYHQSILKNLFQTARGHGLACGLMLVGAVAMARRFPWIAGWAAIQTAAYCMLRVPEYVWYYHSLVFAASFSLLVGVETTLRFIRRGWPRLHPAAAILLVAFVLYWSNLPQSRFAPWQDPRRNAYRQAAEWIRTQDAGPKTIVMDEIGIVGYCLKDYSVFDTVGLSSPGVTRQTMARIEPLVRVHAPSFVVLRIPQGKPAPPAELSYAVDGEPRPIKYRRGLMTNLKAGFAAAVYARASS
ncbi:MAG: hypothetical protein ABFD69_08145 [Candidatus Sumerlaeia bacterium]